MSEELRWGIYSPVKKAFGICLPLKDKAKIERYVADRNRIVTESGKAPHWEVRQVVFDTDTAVVRLAE